MHPYAYHWHRFGRPSRLLWFVVGAVSATWFIKSKEAHRFRMAHCPHAPISRDAYAPAPAPAQQQPPQESVPANAQSATAVTSVPRTEGPPPPQYPQHDHHSRPWGWGWGHGRDSRWESGNESGRSSPTPADHWDEERKHMHEIGKQAQEKFTDFSEATLNSLASTVESLKAKLAEQRAVREAQARELDALREQQARQYEEWKRQQPPRHVV